MKGGDLILDSFAGSGTTAQAIQKQNLEDGIRRKFILVELDSKICREITSERVKRVMEGYKSIKGEKVEGLGGGFRYCKLEAPCFDESGKINEEVSFSDLARHVFFAETGQPMQKQIKANGPLIGTLKETAICLLYNGILKDKKPNGGNVLTQSVLDHLPKHVGTKVVYGTACRLSPSRLKRENIIFKQIPYEIRGR